MIVVTNIPQSQQADLTAALKGNVYAGRAPITVQFLNSGAVSSSVRGQTITMDSSLKALSDVVAIRETTKPTSMRSYTERDRGNANSGRYQIIFGADTRELSAIIKGGVKSWGPDQQDRAFLGRLFYRSLDRGGDEYVQFVQNGYQFADFKAMVQKLGKEWQSLRGNRYYADTKAFDNHLAKYYGSEENGYQFLYEYFQERKQMYDQQNPATIANQFNNIANVTNISQVQVGRKSKSQAAAATTRSIQHANQPNRLRVSLTMEEGRMIASLASFLEYTLE